MYYHTSLIFAETLPPALRMAIMNGSPEAPRPLKLGGHVGFDSLPDQLVNKSVQSGFSFNILSIGETGVGRRS